MEVNTKSFDKKIDEDLYCTQLELLGEEAMWSIQETSVLIWGLRGMGVEIAKNVVLTGPKAVTLYDPSPARPQDLSCNFYLTPTEGRVGTNRAGAVLDQLSQLNSYVCVSCLEGELSEERLRSFQVVVLSDATFSEQLRVGDLCHTAGIKFISVASYGLFGSVFCDFGENFLVADANGKQPRSFCIESISQEEEGVVTCDYYVGHNFETGDWVSFSRVNGMDNLNTCKPQQIKVRSHTSFSIGDTSKFPEYTSGGIVTQCKMPLTLQFKSLRDSLKQPEFVMTDFSKFDRPPQLLAVVQALDLFVAEREQLPRPYNKEDAEQLFMMTEQVNLSSQGVKIEQLDRNLIDKFAFVCRGELMPMVSFLGGIAAQEVLKSCTGKFTPLKQFLFFDALECLPPEGDLPFQEPDSQEDRYSGQRLVFGGEFQQKLADLSYFVVGAGAQGCELLKNFSMMGVGCGPNGKVVITDTNNIERSDLNRQFLFHPCDIGKNKSSVAALAAQKMNPALRIEAHTNKAGPESESVYGDEFFSTLCGVSIALSNVDTRLYLDRRCVYYRLPLLESHTKGSRGGVQVVLPHLTETCCSSSDPPDKSDSEPLKSYSFVYRIEQTLDWAEREFDDLFTNPGRIFERFKSDEGYLESCENRQYESLQMLTDLTQVLSERPSSFPDCVAWARLLFEELFASQIKQLMYHFPPDHLTPEGLPFWSAGRRLCPTPICYDNSSELHLDFVEAASLLYAESRCVPCEGVTRHQIQSLAGQVATPVFQPKAHKDFSSQESQSELNSLKKEVRNLQLPDSFCLRALEVNKDDDSGHCLDFIISCSNLRASNYQIKTATRRKVKAVLFRIPPSIVTSSAAAVGLMCLELYKLTRDQGCAIEKINRENYKNVSFDLALAFISFSEPMLVAKEKCYEREFSLWDRFEIDGFRPGGGEMTLGEFIALFKEKYLLEITLLSYGVHLLFAFFREAKKQKLRMEMQLSKAVEHMTKNPIPPHQSSLVLELCCEDREGNDVEVPCVKYNFRDKPRITTSCWPGFVHRCKCNH